ncbi:antibiotic biosynthesis monooxygenase family protein [Amycolatopsis sp. WGS_07]|uniref:antibiotic biosynthesis monooxygenase family protein n=1 Tax=Amycolatopsis sp. WGS_07 TaxID=3076764 RepID=UPI003873A486
MYTFINRFTVSGDTAEFERLIGEITDHMQTQPGFGSHALYRSGRNANVYLEIALWDSAADHQAATGSPEFRSRVQQVIKLAAADPAPFDLVSEHAAGKVA